MAESSGEPPPLSTAANRNKTLQDKTKEELLHDFKKLGEVLRQTREARDRLKAEKDELGKQLEDFVQKIKAFESNEKAAAPPPAEGAQNGEDSATLIRRLREDVEAARATCEELRSQLDDARAEVSSLRESRATADVFSLELADYEKRVSKMTKELKEAREALAESERQREIAEGELKEEREGRENADEMRREANMEKARLAELQLQLDAQRTRADSMQEEMNKERVALARQVSSSQERATRLEEIVEALRDENVRLRIERENADAKVDEIHKEYESFKSRARYVLEQRAKEEEAEEAVAGRQREERALQEQHERAVKELNHNIDVLRDSHRRCESDLARVQEQLSRAEAEHRATRKEANDNATALGNALDELRMLRVDAEKAREEVVGVRVQLSAERNTSDETRGLLNRVSRELEELRERAREEREKLQTEAAEEKRRREEALKQLEERRRRDERRAAPVAAVYPQFSEPTAERPPSGAATGILPRMAEETASLVGAEGGGESCERSLEDVLFGEEAAGHDVVPIGDLQMISVMSAGRGMADPAEICRVLRQLHQTREMLLESEEAGARMADQIEVLKEEIRRLERNAERKEHLENTEYLKNVIFKFITPERVSGEKAQLLPILSTMLRLTAEEKALLQQTASDTADSGGMETASAQSWGSYLHRWSGLS